MKPEDYEAQPDEFDGAVESRFVVERRIFDGLYQPFSTEIKTALKAAQFYYKTHLFLYHR